MTVTCKASSLYQICRHFELNINVANGLKLSTLTGYLLYKMLGCVIFMGTNGYNFKLKALEPKRWWHYIGIKRKYVDFNISFTINSPTFIKVQSGNQTKYEIYDVSVKQIGNDGFELGTDWDKNSDGWSICGDNAP